MRFWIENELQNVCFGSDKKKLLKLDGKNWKYNRALEAKLDWFQRFFYILQEILLASEYLKAL